VGGERTRERAAGFRLVGGKVGRELMMKDCLTSGLVCLLVVIL